MVNKATVVKNRKQTATQSDILRLRVSGSELARLLGVTPAAITQGVDAGRFRRDAVGRYALGTNVPQYCQSLREAQVSRDAGEQKAETDYWRAARLREQTIEGRRQIAEELADAIVSAWRAVGDKWLKNCTSSARDDFRRLFGSFDEIARSACAEVASEVEDGDDEDDGEGDAEQ